MAQDKLTEAHALLKTTMEIVKDDGGYCEQTRLSEIVSRAYIALEDRADRQEEALLRIKQWAEAYPTKTFKPVTIEDLRHADFALRAIGIDMGALHAAWARRILNGISEICNDAMKEDDCGET